MDKKKKSVLQEVTGQVTNFAELRDLGVSPKADIKVSIPVSVYQGLITLVGNRMQEGTSLVYHQMQVPNEDGKTAEVRYQPVVTISEESMACNSLMLGLQNSLVEHYNEKPTDFMTREEAAKLREAAARASNS